MICTHFPHIQGIAALLCLYFTCSTALNADDLAGLKGLCESIGSQVGWKDCLNPSCTWPGVSCLLLGLRLVTSLKFRHSQWICWLHNACELRAEWITAYLSWPPLTPSVIVRKSVRYSLFAEIWQWTCWLEQFLPRWPTWPNSELSFFTRINWQVPSEMVRNWHPHRPHSSDMDQDVFLGLSSP